MISWKLTVEKILSFSWGLYVSSARSSWFTSDKQGTLTLFFCVVKHRYKKIFDWNCCVDIGSEGKIWKSVQNSLLTAFFTEKMKINHLETGNIPFSWQTVDSFRPFSSPWEDFFWLTTWYIHVFSRKSQNSVTCLGKMQEISALEANIDSFQKFRSNTCHSHTQTLV